VRFEKLDILHVHYAIPHASAAFMAKQILATYGIHIPVVTTLHGTDITLVGKDLTYKPVVTFSINQSDGVTAVSEYLKQDTYKHFEITKDIRVIPNFVDMNRFKLKAKDHFKKAIAPNNERIVVHTSNFRKVKRTQDVIYVFEKILKEVPAKLLMVGDGPERAYCEQLCRDLDICDHVRFLGKQDAVEEILSVADLFIMPSESESFGLAALEAMACEVPVITSNAGGLLFRCVDCPMALCYDCIEKYEMVERFRFIEREYVKWENNMGYTAASTYEYMQCPECCHTSELMKEAQKENSTPEIASVTPTVSCSL
jgi:N-acetyl-alpha-D-glucosaminyl L-malate synthase BshA